MIRFMKWLLAFTVVAGCAFCAPAGDIGIQSFNASGLLIVTNVFTNGVCTVEQNNSIAAVWVPLKNVFTTNPVCALSVEPVSTSFFRALAVDFSDPVEGFTNLVESYNLLTTIAGAGGIGTDGINKWQPEFEGGPATNALLSRPHIAMADDVGNVVIADKDAHAIRKVGLDGTIVTVAGTNEPGDGPDDPTPATEVALNQPNGIWVRGDGVVYILDLLNGKIRKLDTNGLLSTLFTVPGGIPVGRGIWVNADESLAYVCAGTVVKKWTPVEGVTDFASGFVELGNLIVDPWGNLVVTDRRGHRVWRIFADGTIENIAGDGTTDGDGGDGQLATETSLNEVRGVWFLPTGAYFLCTHRGSQVWYVDTAGFIHLFLNGSRSDTHAGDGTWFWNPTEFRVSECRAVTLDRDGNLLITENDSGYIRRVQFLRHGP
jgi:hypothetical protein